MSFNFERSFEASDGFTVKRGAGFYSGSGSPLGNAAPLGSRYVDKDTGEKWDKCGPGDNDWSIVPNHALAHVKKCHEIKECEEMRVSGLRVSGDGNLKISGTLRVSG